ncbi:hypothetical protein ACFCXS_26875 [Streptomyces sp. NPDC056373]|uniref:hypothetical protein n=1 Tax=Streptomyces sp. NPDC056373 TaxID=3345798 RepID=UPI0035DD2309
MKPGAVAPPRRTVYRVLAVGGTLLIAVAVVTLVWAMATWPHPPPAGTTTRDQARTHMRQDAEHYADALAAAGRDTPLTQERLRTLPTPAGLAIGTTTLTTRGASTVVTFSTHASYGSPTARTGTTACYRVTLTPGRPAPTLAEVPVATCGTRREAS